MTGTPVNARTLSEAEYAAAKRDLVRGAAPAPAAPPLLADKPDAECVDVRNLPEGEYERHKAALLARALAR